MKVVVLFVSDAVLTHTLKRNTWVFRTTPVTDELHADHAESVKAM